MVSLRVFCYLLIFFILQLHAIVSNANFDSQAPQAANSEGLGASTTITQVSKKATQDVKYRKMLKHVKVNIEAYEKNGLEIESKEMARNRKNEKKLTGTVSLTADYSNPGHHPPRHN